MGSPVSPNIANLYMDPDSKVHGANMGPIWDGQDPGGGPMLAPGTLLSGEEFETKAMRTGLNPGIIQDTIKNQHNQQNHNHLTPP